MKQVVCGFALSILLAATAAAQNAEGPTIGVEFNDLQQAPEGCRAVFVLNNGMGVALAELTLRIVAFDADAHAALFLSLDVGSLPVNKTRVLRFDLCEYVQCENISRLLLDDVVSCEGPDIDAATCLGALNLSTRAGIPLDF